jgi:hypothetical protein
MIYLIYDYTICAATGREELIGGSEKWFMATAPAQPNARLDIASAQKYCGCTG